MDRREPQASSRRELEGRQLVVVNGDFLDNDLPSESVDLVFADPPFNAGKSYNGNVNDKKPRKEYLEWCEAWTLEVARILRPGGTLWSMNSVKWIGHIMVMSEASGLDFVNLVCWPYANPTKTSGKFPNTWRPIAVYSKGPPKFWDSNAVPLSRGTLYLDYSKIGADKEKKASPYCHDVWADVPKLVGGYLSSKEVIKLADGKFAHPQQMPILLAARAILTATCPGATVLDPFAGSGTVMEAALFNGRSGIAYEVGQDYCKVIVDRIDRLQGLVQAVTDLTRPVL